MDGGGGRCGGAERESAVWGGGPAGGKRAGEERNLSLGRGPSPSLSTFSSRLLPLCCHYAPREGREMTVSAHQSRAAHTLVSTREMIQCPRPPRLASPLAPRPSPSPRPPRPPRPPLPSGMKGMPRRETLSDRTSSGAAASTTGASGSRGNTREKDGPGGEEEPCSALTGQNTGSVLECNSRVLCVCSVAGFAPSGFWYTPSTFSYLKEEKA